MKRVGHVFGQVCDFTALERAAYRAYRANRDNEDALRFMYRLEPEIIALERDLRAGAYCPGPYRCFTIYEPKERHIAAAPFRDRVVHHAVCAALEPVFERRYIHDSYACRIGKGSHSAIIRAQSFARNARYFLKCDIRKYFDSVSHDRLKAMLRRLFKDAPFLALLDGIVDHNAPWHAAGRGIPIGNLTSQYFANLYLDALDHDVKEALRVKRYLRYMDDFLCFGDDKAALHETRRAIAAFLDTRLSLSLKENKSYVASVSQGIPFLGFRVFSGVLRLQRPALTRARRSIARCECACAEGRISEAERAQRVGSLLAHMAHADTLALRRRMFGFHTTI